MLLLATSFSCMPRESTLNAATTATTPVSANTVGSYTITEVGNTTRIITRVPGGWIYTFTYGSNNASGPKAISSTFVPLIREVQ